MVKAINKDGEVTLPWLISLIRGFADLNIAKLKDVHACVCAEWYVVFFRWYPIM